VNKDNNLTEDENFVNSCICFLAISFIINKVLSYYLLLCSFMQKDFMHFIVLIAFFAWSCSVKNVEHAMIH